VKRWNHGKTAPEAQAINSMEITMIQMNEVFRGHPAPAGATIRAWTLIRRTPRREQEVTVLAKNGREALNMAHAILDGKAFQMHALEAA
jgi:hypothetical protein